MKNLKTSQRGGCNPLNPPPGSASVLIRIRENPLSGDIFSGKVGGRLPNKNGRRTGWSQAKPEFAKIEVEQKKVIVVLQYLQDAFGR